MGILLADLVRPVRAEGINDDQLFGPVEALQTCLDRPSIIERQNIGGNRNLFNHVIMCPQAMVDDLLHFFDRDVFHASVVGRTDPF